MKIEVLESISLREKAYRLQLPGGLIVLFMPRAGFSHKVAVLTTLYGSIDVEFLPPGATTSINTPPGIAHFLEHQLFKKSFGDITEKFSRLGASANAATGHDITSFMFTTTSGFNKCLKLLLQLVFDPHFTNEGISLERSIIEQEILMYQDMPSWVIHSNLMRALYSKHPVRHDIAGSLESLAQICRENIELCYRTFYRQENMFLVIAGSGSPNSCFETVRNAMKSLQPPASKDALARRILPSEPPSVETHKVVQHMEVSRPSVLIGFKDTQTGLVGNSLMRRQLLISILLDTILGCGSPLYNKLYEKGLIDDSFDAHYHASSQFAHTTMGGETDHPDELVEALLEGLADVKKRGVPEEHFERIRRKIAGKMMRSFDSAETCAFTLVSALANEVNIFEFPETLQSISHQELHPVLETHLVQTLMSVSAVLPHENR